MDVDSRGNVYVLHRNPAMPIMVFDRSGKFLRAWGDPTAVTVDSGRRDYVAEVNGANVKKFVMKK